MLVIEKEMSRKVEGNGWSFCVVVVVHMLELNPREIESSRAREPQAEL